MGEHATEKHTFDSSLASTSTCSGAVVGVSLEILWSPLGELSDPQARIVSARETHRLGSLRFTRQNPAERQTFEFTFTVSFLRLDDGGDAAVSVPPRPEIPIWLPYDLFYPFGLGSGAKRTHGRPTQLGMALPALVLMAWSRERA